MIPMLANHLWQSTVFAVAAGLLTLALQRNHAQARHAIWMAASVKFLIPFFLIVSAGSHLQWPHSSAPPPRFSLAVQEISQPFELPTEHRVSPAPAATSHPLRPVVLITLWLSGFAGLLLFWGIRWHRLRSTLRGASSIDLGAPITAMSSPACVEPGVFGVFRPVLLLPSGITERLTPEQLSAIVAHELCHVRRRDNLAAAIHMVVEAVFWFHPLVWWIGARLIEERERACDEEVLRMGSERQVYAEGILNVCRFYVESPLACVSGVTGSNLRKRIEEIMTHQIPRKLNFGRKLLLAAAGFAAVAAPIVIGVANAPRLRAQPQSVKAAFEVASVKANKSTDFRNVVMVALPGGTLTIRNIPLRVIITQAYNLPFQNSERVSGTPQWVNSESFAIKRKRLRARFRRGSRKRSAST